jgi:DNA-binding IclR family transcriptional regulator
MKEANSRTSPRRILNILEEILLDPENFTAKKISHKLNIPLATVYRHIETLCDESTINKLVLVEENIVLHLSK